MVTLSHRACRADNGPYCEAAAEGDEGLLAEATPDLVDGIFIVEVAVMTQRLSPQMPNCRLCMLERRVDIRIFVEGGWQWRGIARTRTGSHGGCGGGGGVV